jgi:hypothetical protein
MSKDLSKIFKNGNNFQFKKVDYSNTKVREDLRKFYNQKSEINKTTDFSIYDLQKITLY